MREFVWLWQWTMFMVQEHEYEFDIAWQCAKESMNGWQDDWLTVDPIYDAREWWSEAIYIEY